MGDCRIVYALPDVFSGEDVTLKLVDDFMVYDFVELIERGIVEASLFVFVGLLYFGRGDFVLSEFGYELPDGKVVVDLLHVSVEVHVVEGYESSGDLKHVFPC